MHERNPELNEQYIEQIKILMLDHTDGEIIKTLGIGKTKYYALKKAITSESTENFKNQRWEDFSTYLENYDALLAECISVLRTRMKETGSAKEAVLCAGQIKDIATARINLKSDGLKALKQDSPGIVERTETKELPEDYDSSAVEDDDDGAFEYDASTGKMEHVKSTDDHPIV